MDYLKEERKKRNRRKRFIRRVTMTIMTIMLVSLATSCIFLVIQYTHEKNKVIAAMNEVSALEEQLTSGAYITTFESEQRIKEAVSAATESLLKDIQSRMEKGETTLTLLENLFPDKIVTAHDGSYHFFEINESLAMNSFDYADFTYPVLNEETNKYEGDVTLSQSSGISTRKGIDISRFQGKIKWQKVANDGIEFAYIRLGYRGYGSGKIVLDDTYEYNIEGANAAGIDTGVYFFTEAISKKEAIEEAEFVLENLEGQHINLPIVLDVEESASSDSRTKDLTKEERTEIIIAFCERIKEAGHDVMIYGNTKSFLIMMDMEKLEDYDKWFAYYKYPLRFPYKMKMWQYTSNGTVDGIEGGVDINISFDF